MTITTSRDYYSIYYYIPNLSQTILSYDSSNLPRLSGRLPLLESVFTVQHFIQTIIVTENSKHKSRMSIIESDFKEIKHALLGVSPSKSSKPSWAKIASLNGPPIKEETQKTLEICPRVCTMSISVTCKALRNLVWGDKSICSSLKL